MSVSVLVYVRMCVGVYAAVYVSWFVFLIESAWMCVYVYVCTCVCVYVCMCVCV